MKFNIITEDLAKIIVRCVEDATGDVIKEDLARSELVYQNSTPHRVWDHIFSLLTKNLDAMGYPIISTNSGPWKFPIIYDRESGNIITIMREKRFAVLRRQQQKRDKPHYVDMLTATLNKELLPQYPQMSLLEKPPRDFEEMKKRADAMLQDFGGKADQVRNHVLILFEARGFSLYSIRAIKVTPDLELAVDGEVNLSALISAKPSIITDKIAKPDAPANNPTRGLKLKKKAIERKANAKLKDNREKEESANQ
jgi:hypothetical protein